MTYPATTDPAFLDTLRHWTHDARELLLLIRFHAAAGLKSFEFFPNFPALADRLRQLPPRTCVTAFRQPQLPIRGPVDDTLITTCLRAIPDGTEYLIVGTTPTTGGWFIDRPGTSHTELRANLEDLRGQPVAAGPHPDWLEDNEDVTSAVVPNPDGSVATGIY